MENDKIKELAKEYDLERRQTAKIVLDIIFVAIGIIAVISGFLFRTQYPLVLKNQGQIGFKYHHLLMRDVTTYNYFNVQKGHTLRYYIVYYRDHGKLRYEMETTFATYSAHAQKENRKKGITDHSVIQESVKKYAFSDKLGNCYCYNEKTSIIKAWFDVGNSTGKLLQRLLLEGAGAALAVVFGIRLKKNIKMKRSENNAVY